MKKKTKQKTEKNLLQSPQSNPIPVLPEAKERPARGSASRNPWGGDLPLPYPSPQGRAAPLFVGQSSYLPF